MPDSSNWFVISFKQNRCQRRKAQGGNFFIGHTIVPEKNPTTPRRQSARGYPNFFDIFFTMSPTVQKGWPVNLAPLVSKMMTRLTASPLSAESTWEDWSLRSAGAAQGAEAQVVRASSSGAVVQLWKKK
jgi:hypothetical protein